MMAPKNYQKNPPVLKFQPNKQIEIIFKQEKIDPNVNETRT